MTALFNVFLAVDRKFLFSYEPYIIGIYFKLPVKKTFLLLINLNGSVMTHSNRLQTVFEIS